MAGRLTAEITPEVSEFLQQFSGGLVPAIAFGAEQARVFLKNGGLGNIVQEIAAGAGEGFPVSYRNHLVVAMSRLPLAVFNDGEVVQVVLDLEPLGDYGDLEKGLHHNAMVGTLDNGFEHSYRITTKSLLKQVNLPYDGEPLMNDSGRRTEWWNTAIVNRDFGTMVGKNWNWTKPSLRTREDAWDAENVPTFEQVATARVNEAWRPLGVAPEWLQLEDGTPAGTEPVVEPQGFKLRLGEYMYEVGFRYIQEALIAFKRLIEERGVIGVSGPQNRPYNSLGQYVHYKDLLL